MAAKAAEPLVPLSAVKAELMAMIALAARVAEAEQADAAKSVARYLHDPAAFAAECIAWDRVRMAGSDENAGNPIARGLAPYQSDTLMLLDRNKRVAVRGPRGLGKSVICAVAVLWFALTRESAGIDWKIVTTAASWDQLRNYLWPEIHKWAGYVRWDIVRGGKAPRGSDELMRTAFRLDHGLATAAAPADSAKIEGAHADSIMILFDEAKGIPVGTWDAIEGAMNGLGEALALAVSTPGDPLGRFYDIHTRKAGLEDWTARHVTLDEAVAAGRISRKWADQRIRQYGLNSQFVQIHVLGEFCASDEDSVIPLAWVEAAVRRWHDWNEPDPETGLGPRRDMDGPHVVGADIARYGRDLSVLAIRNGPVITELKRFAKQGTTETSGHVKAILDSDPSMTAIVDADGIGGAVVDQLRAQSAKVTDFVAQRSVGHRKDSAGAYGFSDYKSWAWWSLREKLDPANNPDICLPDDEKLIADLCTPKYTTESGAKIKVEGKKELRKRLGRSPDDGDAVVMALSVEGATWFSAYVSVCDGCGCKYNALRPACPQCGAAKNAAA